ncbi:peptidoglycan-binding protein [Limnoraphis robusta Tam1]|uniref:peptidoglycan-binding domain-containing protein n=1 Tax=Limnoraphis robusta TaxID=1118279 RepID=UPI002B2032C9|nr:peptidoglycan-binding protein [Limnoraphis robusta]MEA5495785.1 peptidoglycan-binding protein [Limnoraphis robusta BA-68 BA1]MEA5540034.1 peptidoglycan-binding protein [Limnoraphis robusta Tam1]
MDSYAYLHLAVVYEDPSQYPLKPPASINWNKFSSLTYRYFLSLALLVAVLSVSQSASAQVIREGDRGSEVSAIQSSLQSLGFFNSNVTGFFGPITREAVIRFQQSRGLSADGVVGSNTLAALGLSQPQNPPFPPISRAVIGLGQGDSGPGVRDLQTRLRQLGYFNTEPTGNFGSITRDAVIRFQQVNRIPVTGLVSEETLVFLNNRIPTLPGNPNPTPLPSGTLKRGDTGPAVGVLQQRLFRLGFYNGQINNFFDVATEQAVIRFQQAYGIQPTGQVGPTTVSYLISATGEGIPSVPSVPIVNPPVNLQLGDRGGSVSVLQQRLRVLGYYSGPMNGIFDLTTRRAVLAFQRDYGIAQTGVVGPTTQSFLVRAVPEFQPVAVSQVPNWFAPQGRPLNIAPQPNLLPPQGRPTVISEVYDGIVPPGRPTLIPEVSDGVVSQGRPLNPSPLTPISPVATYRSVVSVGDTGFEVRKVQQRLRELNYYRGPINGFFDRTTEDAVLRFQRANGITQTGVIGPTTRIYMFNSAQASGSTSRADASPSVASPSTQTAQTLPQTPTVEIQNPPISTASVQELQKRLQVQGLYQGPIDGVYNSQMEVALSKAQELYGTSANDVLFGGLQSK